MSKEKYNYENLNLGLSSRKIMYRISYFAAYISLIAGVFIRMEYAILGVSIMIYAEVAWKC